MSTSDRYKFAADVKPAVREWVWIEEPNPGWYSVGGQRILIWGTGKVEVAK